MQHTQNYNLDMPEGNDQLSVMVNYNGNLQKIDAAIKDVDDKADAATAEVGDISATVGVLENNVTAVNARLDDVETDVTAVDEKADAIEVKADNALAGLETKQSTIVGGASTITSTNLTTSRALVSDASGKVSVSNITSTELGRLSGVSSNIQTQITNLRNHVDTPVYGTPTTDKGTIVAYSLLKIGHICFLEMNWHGVYDGTHVGYTPAGFRPITQTAITAYDSGTGEYVPASIKTNGEIQIGGHVGMENITVGAVYYSPSTT